MATDITPQAETAGRDATMSASALEHLSLDFTGISDRSREHHRQSDRNSCGPADATGNMETPLSQPAKEGRYRTPLTAPQPTNP